MIGSRKWSIVVALTAVVGTADPAAAEWVSPTPAVGDESRVVFSWRYTMKSALGRGRLGHETGRELGFSLTWRERVTAVDGRGAAVEATIEAITAEGRSLDPGAPFLRAGYRSSDPAAGDQVLAAAFEQLLGKTLHFRRLASGGVGALAGGAELQRAVQATLKEHAEGRLSGWGGDFLHDLAPRLTDEHLRDALNLVRDVLPGEGDAGADGWVRGRRQQIPELVTFTFSARHRPLDGEGSAGVRVEQAGAPQLSYWGADLDPAVADADPEFRPLFAAMRDQRLTESKVAGEARWDTGGLRASEVEVAFTSVGAAPGPLGKLGLQQRLAFQLELRLRRLAHQTRGGAAASSDSDPGR